ncbi:MAG: VWA domain-containing protein, partial [Acidobacteriota bacterium]|nr:VWA domain-containing protein [Acidobacteriota bacterium]
ILSGEIFAQVKDMIDLDAFSNEEIMVVSLGNGLRIATPFTVDRHEVRRSIDRVLNDPANFGGNFDHLTENAFFSQIKVLLDVLEAVPGRKAVVLFTGRLGNGFEYDPYFKELAALSATARVALYPVDTAGLEIEPLYRPEQAGGPKKLARLAVETGGRLTWNTNDLTLGYTRAQRDLACSYEIAFYDERPRLDRQRRVRVWLKRRGVHAYHASAYIFRSPENKRRSLITAAYMAPDMFEAGTLEARVYPLRPRGEGKWETLVAIGFPITPDSFEQGLARWDLGGVVRKDTGTRIRTFNRRIEVEGSEASEPRRSVSFLEPVVLRPGRYQISVVLSSRTADRPLALTADLELPRVPTRHPFLVGPILGRRAGDDVVILGKGLDDPGASEADRIRTDRFFEPLLTQSAEKGVPVAALTQVCLVDPEGQIPDPIVRRQLIAAGGVVVGSLPPVSVELERTGRARCGMLLDWIPTTDLSPGQYFVEARAASGTATHLGSETAGTRLEVVRPRSP